MTEQPLRFTRHFPHELLLLIFKHLKPGDIVTYQKNLANSFHPEAPVLDESYFTLLNICQASRQFRILGQQVLFSHVQIPQARQAIALVRSLLERPLLQNYVLGLTVTVVDDIQTYGGQRCFPDEQNRWDEIGETLRGGVVPNLEDKDKRAHTSRLCTLILDDIRNNTEELEEPGHRLGHGIYFRRPAYLANMPPDWASPCQYLYACLLCLLPNLREVAFVTPAGIREWPDKVISRTGLENVLNQVLARPGFYHPEALQMLRKVSFQSGGTGWDGLFHPAHPGFFKFADISNLNDITAGMYFLYPPGTTPKRLASRHIHTLHVSSDKARITHWPDLRTLMTTSDRLQRLTLEVEQRMATCSYRKKDDFMYAKQLIAKTLPRLSYLHIVANPPSIGPPAPVNFLRMNKSTLEKLPALRHLKITGHLYMLTQYEKEDDHDYPDEKIMNLNGNTTLKVNPHRNLAALIPSNIESFGFRETVRHGRGFVPDCTQRCSTWPFSTRAEYEEWFEGMWMNLAEACGHRELPNLKRIVVYGDRFEDLSTAKKLRKGFEGLDVEFTVLPSLEAWNKWCWSIDGVRD